MVLIFHIHCRTFLYSSVRSCRSMLRSGGDVHTHCRTFLYSSVHSCRSKYPSHSVHDVLSLPPAPWLPARNPESSWLQPLLRVPPALLSLLPHNILSFFPCLLFLSCGSACSYQKHICSHPKDITIHCHPVQEFFHH